MEAKLTDKGCPQINAEPNRKNAAFIRRLYKKKKNSMERGNPDNHKTLELKKS